MIDQRTRRINSKWGAPYHEKSAAAWRLAVVGLMNGSVPKLEQDAAVRAARLAGVSTSEYLRSRLLLKAGIPTELLDGTADD